MPETHMLKRRNYSQLGLPAGPYVHAVKHQQTLYTSGFTAYGTSAQNGTIEEQTREIFKQLELIARQEHSSLQQLIKVTLYVTDISNIDGLRQALMTIYGESLPASSLIKVDALFLPELLIEVEAILGTSKQPPTIN